MKAFLLALKQFAASILGTIVVVVIVLWHWDILGMIENFPPMNLLTIGRLLSLVTLLFVIIWSQLKSKALLSHGILLYLFASALSGFISALFSNTPSSAFDGTTFVNLLVMLYTLGVVAAYLLYDRPKTASLNTLVSLPLLVFAIVYYLRTGFNSTLLVMLVVTIALLLGSKIAALGYAMYVTISPLFLALHTIVQAFSNNTGQSFNVWFNLVTLAFAFVFLALEFFKSIQRNET